MNKHTSLFLKSLLFSAVACLPLQAGLTTYPDPPNAVVSSVFSLTIDGTPVTVMEHMDYHYAHFAFDGTVSATVTAPESIGIHTISPLSLSIQGQANGTDLTFSMAQVTGADSTPHYLVLQVNSLDKLVILGDPPELDVPPSSGPGIYNVVTQYGADPTGASYTQPAIQNAVNAASNFGTPANPGIVYVPPGLYTVREDLFLRSNVDLYLAPGAVLKADEDPGNYTITSNGTIDAVLVVDDAANVTIRGRGVVDASGVTLMNLFSLSPPVFLEQSSAHPRRRIITTNDVATSSNVEINGIVAKDATGWSIDLVKTAGVTVQNVKVLNHKDINWKIQNDGINATSSSDVLINQCFVMTIDDAMCSKARYQEVGSMDNVVFSNNVLWNWAAGVKCGMQNSHPMNGVVFRNIDIVHCRRAIALDTKTSQDIGQTIPIENVAFTDIRVEEMNGHWNISSRDAVEFLLEDAPVNNITITNFSLPGNRPLRTGPTYPANDITFHNLIMDGVAITDVSQVTLTGSQPINNLTFFAGPGVELSGPSTHDESAFIVTARFTDDVTGLTEADFIITNGTASGLAGGPSVYTVIITPATGGPVSISLPEGAAQDALFNNSLPSNLLQVLEVFTGSGFQESGGVLSMEAENGTLGSLWITGADAAASGGLYVEVNPAYTHSGSSPVSELPDALVSYRFTISTPGDYRFWFRLLSTSGTDDSFFWRINDGAWVQENGRFNSVPTWYSTDNPAVNSLIPGGHVLEIAYRENGTRLDKFVLQLDSATAPTGDGPPESNKASADPFLSIMNTGSGLEINYSGTLQQSDDLSNWSDLDPQPASPFLVPNDAIGSGLFFRAGY